jgi:asparagine synthase (glutamine-hydrolysing)
MCSIVGLRQERAGDLRPVLVSMLKATSRRGPDGAGIATRSKTRHGRTLGALDAAPMEGAWGMGHLRLAITGVAGAQPLRDCAGRFVLAINGEIWNHEVLRAELEESHTMSQDADSVVVPHLIESHLDNGARGRLSVAVGRALARLDGEFAFAAMDDRECVLVRDRLGIKPLYYAAEAGRAAFASEKKALWSLGLEARPVPPGRMVVLTPSGSRVRRWTRVVPPPQPYGDRDAARAAYAKALEHAIEKRVRGVRRVGIVYSGGVDSALVARGAARADAQGARLVTETPGAPDVEAARAGAAAMDLPLRVVPLDLEEVRRAVPEILAAVEERNQLHVETALPLFFVSRAAAREGFRVLLTGQGADELFAGYAWYPRVLAERGEPALRRQLREDRDLLSSECLEREDKVSMWNHVELRVPFLDPAVVAAAESMPTAFLTAVDDAMGKRIHRELAEAWGVPSQIAWRRKEAAQHGSGAREALLQAAAHAQPPPTYDPEASVPELVGSSQRYGHRYMARAKAWRLDAKLQWWLDEAVLARGLVAPEEGKRLRAYLQSAHAAMP